ncbi:hypothetical protein Mapa_005047 [Marchantia paleacea]|nr:hypothetical protein Mapa_005047 [Marchantia paleacea]
MRVRNGSVDEDGQGAAPCDRLRLRCENKADSRRSDLVIQICDPQQPYEKEDRTWQRRW